MNPITSAVAEKKGLRPLAGPYSAKEDWMAENVSRDMRRGGIDHALVEVKGGAEVWRSNCGWRDTQ